MAHAKICDRCGAFFKPYNNKMGEYNGVRRIRTGSCSSNVDSQSNMIYELCPECMNKLGAFLNMEEYKEKEQND